MKRSVRAAPWLAAAFVATAASPLGGCSVAANLSADELLREVDRIVRIEGAAPDYRVVYTDQAKTSSWVQRSLYFGAWLLVIVIQELLDDDEADDDEGVSLSTSGRVRSGPPLLEYPVEHVRELLRELPDEVGDDLRFAGLAASRYGWVAHYDAYPLSRIESVDGLVRVAAAIELPLFQGDLRRFGFGPEPADVAAAARRVGDLRPDRRKPAGARDVAEYEAALTQAVAAPLQAPHARIQLVEHLSEAYLAEPDEALRERTAVALRAAYAHMVERLLLDLVRSRAVGEVDLRLCAMDQIRAAGGPAAVPLLLALMAAGPDELARGETQYDPDPLVRLRLVHFCGQLRGARLDETLSLPGRDGVLPAAPADFLAVTALNESTYTSRLRTPAITALSWALERRTVDLDLGWIQEWRKGRR